MRFLIVDDEENIRKTTQVVLEGMKHQTVAVASGSEALKQLAHEHFDVAFLDLKLNGEHGLEVLVKLLKAAPMLDVVICSAYATVSSAVEAMQYGAVNVIEKPFTPERIRQVTTRVTEMRRLKTRVAELESRIPAEYPEIDLTTSDPAMQRLFDLAMKTAGSAATLMILGESGTGKSVLAREIHAQSPQRENPLVTVSCGSLSRELINSELFGHVKGSFTGAVSDTWGKVARADGGTLFFDEIGDLPWEIQPKLLRLLQEKEYERVGESKPRRANVRVIAATHHDLRHAVAQGAFRQDLFYRLNVITLHMPPLRERIVDLLRLAEGYLGMFAAQCGKKLKGFSPEAVQAMKQYSWPGNLRELRNVIERAVILAAHDRLQSCDFPETMQDRPASHVDLGASITLQELESEHIRRVLSKSDSMEEAARTLGIDPATLYRKRKSVLQK